MTEDNPGKLFQREDLNRFQLEIDFTFYSLLLDKDGQPAKNFHVLKSYAQYITEADRVVLKVPQVISAQKVRHGKSFIANETYLDPKIFINRFYEPAVSLLGDRLAGLIFEQEYQRIIRLMTPIGVRYEDAYARAFPFDKLVDGMVHQGMIQDTVEIMRKGIDEETETSILVNNRSGGNPPLLAEKIASAFSGRF